MTFTVCWIRSKIRSVALLCKTGTTGGATFGATRGGAACRGGGSMSMTWWSGRKASGGMSMT
ncbi:hypothethical protein (plasmid) [Ralstonia solanacearum CMR15]|nr:hypothethical protein [Ralstonia solanacearum CMR15]